MMLTYKRHLKPFHAAVQAAEPLILLPPLHPRYLQSLIAEWQAAPGPRREARLIEPWVGSMTITAHGLGAPAAAGRELPLGQWLMRQYDALEAHIERVWWVPELDAALVDPQQLALLVATARRIAASGSRLRLLLGATSAELPAALRPWTRQLELMAPRLDDEGDEGDADEDRDFGLRILRAQQPAGEPLADALRAHKLDDGKGDAALRFISTLQGLDAGAMNIVVEAFYREYRPELDITSQWRHLLNTLNDERRRQLQRASGLSVVDVSQEALQGMNRFQRYLDYVDVLLRDRLYDRKEGGPRPRGVLLVGLPGTGKSLAAHTTARKLGLPLLRMDIGAMMGRYLGESEGNLRRALDAAEAAAPCVLWVDELEKALGGIATGQGDTSGTGSRMLAQLLTWMQGHDAQVYLFATANKVHDLPPELLRRGRFDELWRVILPRDEERREILISKLARVGDETDTDLLLPSSVALTELVKLTKDYTGADLEALVNEAWMRARVHESKVNAALIKDIIKNFKPLSSQFADKIKADIEVLDKHGFLDVSCDQDQLLPLVPDARKTSNRIHPDLLQFLSENNTSKIIKFFDIYDYLLYEAFFIKIYNSTYASLEIIDKNFKISKQKSSMSIKRNGSKIIFNLSNIEDLYLNREDDCLKLKSDREVVKFKIKLEDKKKSVFYGRFKHNYPILDVVTKGKDLEEIQHAILFNFQNKDYLIFLDFSEEKFSILEYKNDYIIKTVLFFCDNSSIQKLSNKNNNIDFRVTGMNALYHINRFRLKFINMEWKLCLNFSTKETDNKYTGKSDGIVFINFPE